MVSLQLDELGISAQSGQEVAAQHKVNLSSLPFPACQPWKSSKFNFLGEKRNHGGSEGLLEKAGMEGQQVRDARVLIFLGLVGENEK